MKALVSVLRGYLGKVRSRLRIRTRLRNWLRRIAASDNERTLAKAKAKVDALLKNSKVCRLYMAQSIPYLFDVLHEKRQVFDKIWAEYRNPVTHLRDPIRIVQFMNLLEIANTAPEGDYLEVGTFQGEAAKVFYMLMDPSRTLYCIDTFEGFVEPDLIKEKEINPACTWTVGNFLDTSPERVGTYIGDGEIPDNLVLIKGWFPEAFAGLEDRKWRFVHLDMDLYEPTRAGLEILWPRIVPGGVMVFHDYENLSFPGVKIAVDKYFSKIGLTVLHMGDLWGSAMIVKPHPDSIASEVERFI